MCFVPGICLGEYCRGALNDGTGLGGNGWYPDYREDLFSMVYFLVDPWLG